MICFCAHRRVAAGLLVCAWLIVLPEPLLAQQAGEPRAGFAAAKDTAFILNSLLFLIGGFLVMWMAAGFAMLEAGLVRSKNVSVQCLKNIGLYSIAGLMFWVMGYNLAYPGNFNGYLGGLGGWVTMPEASADLRQGGGGDPAVYSVASDWFFQMAFCATTASIVSGTIAERTKLIPFFIFTAVLTGLIYPIVVIPTRAEGDSRQGFPRG